MATKKKSLQAAAGSASGGEPVYIDQIFSTYLYTGTGSSHTITNGIDLDGEGGMVWLKSRTNAYSSRLYDTERGATESLASDDTGAELTLSTGLTSFNADGFSLGSHASSNESSADHASWTFRKAPGFFDVVTWTGDGTTGRAIPHNLGTDVGFIVAKKTSGTGDWNCLHKSVIITGSPAYGGGRLNLTGAFNAYTSGWNDTFPTSEEFYVSHISGASNATLNTSGETYVAYLFADGDDAAAQIFGTNGDQAVVKCGSYTGNGSTTGPEINLGWEPQWVMIKPAGETGFWRIFDTMRGLTADPIDQKSLFADDPTDELNNGKLSIKPTGFKIEEASNFNTSGVENIYIAIRRGPMRVPESGTEVFAIDTANSTGNAPPLFDAGFPIDFALRRPTSVSDMYAASRLTQGKFLRTTTTDAESSNSLVAQFDYQNGYYDGSSTSSSNYSWMFKRSPGFFDVVCFTSNTTLSTVPHNLTVTPELMIVKNRTTTEDWYVVHKDSTNYPWRGLFLNKTDAVESYDVGIFNSVDANEFEYYGWGSGDDYIAYLFASQDGISKVGSYTGNGTSQTIDCGFSSGARFVLIKRASGGTGNWMLYDTERGITSSSDPVLKLNNTDPEESYNHVQPNSSGFSVTYINSDVNKNGDTYIYLAIA